MGLLWHSYKHLHEGKVTKIFFLSNCRPTIGEKFNFSVIAERRKDKKKNFSVIADWKSEQN